MYNTGEREMKVNGIRLAFVALKKRLNMNICQQKKNVFVKENLQVFKKSAGYKSRLF